ncbi:hypothetical protein HIM_03513 [Hirsutella minnesotensis 3608]|uniref:Amine oxidase domain-containing protein n=1 Tax=Hirsutella minnesotensis 3608 TaxID=1043627 RepID=A0A0F8A2R4_9HYPO|nr:hypothetical protein HIM_03513 [Hirsutella minnesotensis 3608]
MAHVHQTRVAIIGTGLAGLTTAHLLNKDAQGRYRVTLFEQADSLSFDSASAAVKDEKTGVVERVDLPMRACAGGYYHNLLGLYDHLGIPLHPVRFLFVFAKALQASSLRYCEAMKAEDAGSAPGTYFVHASNLHQTPPPWPANRGTLLYIIEVLYLVFCQFWFTAACFLVSPKMMVKTASCETSMLMGETLAEYLQRIWLPRRYVTHYLLPLMSSVSTCSHDELMTFPASDVINYKRLSHGQQHYTVCGGVRQVQSKLADGIQDVRLESRVTSVEVDSGGLIVHWQSTSSSTTKHSTRREHFDRVVLAVSPDVAGRIFQPLLSALHRLPTRRVESSVLSAEPGAWSIATGDAASAGCSHHRGTAWPAQVITFRTQFGGACPRTQALHAMPGGVLVSTSPLDSELDSKAALRTATFTRTLRTPESRAILQSIMGSHEREPMSRGPKVSNGAVDWVNGEDNVWLAGAWCWDGMVLLEGCVVSAMRVSRDFGVRIPWEDV